MENLKQKLNCNCISRYLKSEWQWLVSKLKYIWYIWLPLIAIWTLFSSLGAALYQSPCKTRYPSSQTVQCDTALDSIRTSSTPKIVTWPVSLLQLWQKDSDTGFRKICQTTLKLKAERLEKARMWTQSLKATLTRKESRAKHFETKILRLALGRQPTLYR